VHPECRSRMCQFENLVNQEAIRRMAEAPGGFRDHFSGLRILTVGRLTRQKGYDVAIDAMRIIRDRGVNARWYVIGDGILHPDLEEQIHKRRLERDFKLLGSKDNPLPYMKQCDIYAHATRFEGKSIAIREAMTVGCAIVASDRSGNREQIEDHVNGIFCSFTPEGIADAVCELAADEALRKRLGRAAAAKCQNTEEQIGKLTELMEERIEE